MTSIRKDDGLLAIQDYSIFEDVADRAGEDAALNVTTFADEIVWGVAMGDPFHVLLNDGPFVEIRRHKMRGGADQLHAALVGLMIRPGALESWQEGMVDVDAAAG